MLLTASLTLLSLLASVALTLAGVGTPLAVAHLAFAVGIVPLIFAAIIHFVPVLTRSGDPGRWIARLPIGAQVAGLLAVLTMQGWLPAHCLPLAATVDAVFAAILLNWIVGRSRATLGSPHPGWRWYGAALGCLMLALLAIVAISIWPQQWHALRLFHLHLNTLGLVGMAALGTLPLLMPTALGKPDPDAAAWLRKHLAAAAGAALAIAAGAAIAWPFSVLGGMLMLLVAVALLRQWYRRFGFDTLISDGVTASLLAALAGLLLTLAAGFAHAAGLLPPRPDLLAWAVGFLLPLVSGALSQLLPVWRWPGPQIPARAIMRQRLVATGRARAVLFFASAVSLLGGLQSLAALLLAVAMLLFAFAVLQAVRVSRSTR